MSSVGTGCETSSAPIHEELATLHGDTAHRELVRVGSPCVTTSDGEPPRDKAINAVKEVARPRGCSPKAEFAPRYLDEGGRANRQKPAPSAGRNEISTST
jgi:hypothetical protein